MTKLLKTQPWDQQIPMHQCCQMLHRTLFIFHIMWIMWRATSSLCWSVDFKFSCVFQMIFIFHMMWIMWRATAGLLILNFHVFFEWFSYFTLCGLCDGQLVLCAGLLILNFCVFFERFSRNLLQTVLSLTTSQHTQFGPCFSNSQQYLSCKLHYLVQLIKFKNI